MSDQPQTPDMPREPEGPHASEPAAPAAGVEVLDEAALMEVWQQGVESEGIEASQIGAIVTATLLIIVVLVIAGIVVTTQGITVASGESEDVEAEDYVELEQLRAAADDKLTDWKLVSAEDGIYQMPIEEAMALVTARYEDRQATLAGLVQPPDMWSTQDLFNRDQVVAQTPPTAAVRTTAPAPRPDINAGVTPLGPDELTEPEGTP
ncbi:MAG: hypothetical protein AAF730_16580 [Bacteroidota bacterium]